MEEYRDISFNPELLKITHYQHYPQMIPFVGKNYEKTKLLVIAESHYLPPDSEAHKQQCVYEQAGKDHNPKPTAESLFNNWYKNPNPIPKIWNGATLKDNVDSFNSGNYAPKENAWCWVDWTWTAKIVAAVEWNNGGHRIYKVLRDAFNEVLRNENNRKIERLEDCAFMNFFQRPAQESGKSIQHNHNTDIEVAGATLQAVCEILEPTKIFFVSSRAYNAFREYINKHINNKEHPLGWELAKNSCQAIQMTYSFNKAIVGHSAHPGCSWWNRKSKNYTKKKGGDNNTGKEAFEYFISDKFKF